MRNVMRSGARRALGLGAAGGVLALTVLLTGAGLQARADDGSTPKANARSVPDGHVYTRRIPRQKADDPKKDDANKADNTKKDNATRDDGRGGNGRNDQPRAGDTRGDGDLQHQIDQLRREVQDLRHQMERGARAFPVPPNFPGTPNFPSPEQMMFGRMPHGRMGVIVAPTGETLADQLNLKKGQGLVVVEVRQDSAAAKAGLKAHDVLVEMDGKPVPDNVREFAQMVGEIKANAPVDVVVIRKGKQETVKGLSLPEATEPRFPTPPGGPAAPRFNQLFRHLVPRTSSPGA